MRRYCSSVTKPYELTGKEIYMFTIFGQPRIGCDWGNNVTWLRTWISVTHLTQIFLKEGVS